MITNEQFLERTRQETTALQVKKEHGNGLVTHGENPKIVLPERHIALGLNPQGH